jgi:hypothetical protein
MNLSESALRSTPSDIDGGDIMTEPDDLSIKIREIDGLADPWPGGALQIPTLQHSNAVKFEITSKRAKRSYGDAWR